MVKKSILSEAIAEARQIRETALENAKKQLEESLTPGIKQMLAHKLNEELELEENVEEESLEESAGLTGFKEVKPAKSHTVSVNEAEEEDEEPVEDPETADEPAEEEPEAEEAAEEDSEAAEADDENSEEEPVEDPENAEESAEEEPEAVEDGEAEVGDDTPLSDITVGDLKNMIADMVSASIPATEPAPEGNQGIDMTPAPVQGTGEEEAPVSGGPQPAGMEAEDPATEEAPEESDEEIDLSELLKELEEEAGFEANDQRGKGHDKNDSLEGIHQDSETKDNGIQENKKAEHGPDCDCEACKKAAKAEKDLKKAKKELAEALQTVKELKDTLNEVNLVNSKLVYMTRTLNSKNLSESQKSVVVHTFDKAESIKEVKDIYKMLQESLNITKPAHRSTSPRMLSEHRGSASRFAGNASKAKAVEVDETVRRFQRLAGIVSED